MARKRGEYQRRKELQNKITNLVVVLGFLVFTLFFLYDLIQCSMDVYDIDHDSLNTYVGSFQYTTRKTTRHTIHVFTLENGDELCVSGRFIENEEMLTESKELRFQYSAWYSNLLYGSYSALSITTTDEEITIVDIDRSRRDSVAGIWIFSIMAVLSSSMLVGLFVMSDYTCNWKRRCQTAQKRKQIDLSK